MNRVHSCVLFALATVLLAGPAYAGRQIPKVESIELKAGIHMLTGRGANLGVLAGQDGVFLIDTQYPESNEPLRSAIKKISDKPVRYLVITHWHFDHVGGIDHFMDSGAVVIAHDNVREKLRTGQYLDTVKRQVAPAKAESLPVLTYSDTLTLHMNGETVRCIHIPLAHSNGDTVVHFTRAKVVHMGDLYFNGLYPYIDVNSGGNIDGMIRAVNKVLDLTDSGVTIIPGHGPVANREELKKYRFMLETIRDRVRPMVEKGLSLKEVQNAKPTAEFDARWGGKFLTPDQFVEIVYYGMKASAGK